MSEIKLLNGEKAHPLSERGIMISTALYDAGPYRFQSLIPIIGTSADQPTWLARVDGGWIKGGFASLEDAMRAALAASGR